MIITLLILLIAFQLKHFIADYPLQTKFMLGKFRDDGWLIPLLAHVGVHAVITFSIVFAFCLASGFAHPIIVANIAAAFDATAHFVMDRVKASPKMLGRFKPLTAETYLGATEEQIKSNTYFWWSLGFDQLFHGLTDTIIVWAIVRFL